MIKKVSFWLTMVVGLLALGGCKKPCNEDDPTTPKVKLVFHTQSGGQDIQSDVSYTRSNGETFQIDLLKYYISHCVLVNNAGDSVSLNGHSLIDPINGKNTFSASVVDIGNYNRMRFLFGVDELHNHSGNQEGDLDPVNGMIWTWSTGYIFYKHEGTFIDTSGNSMPLLYHFGMDRALVPIDVPITISIKNNMEYEVHVHFNLDQFYNGIYFSGNNVHQSAGVADYAWMDALKTNLPASFEVSSIIQNAILNE